ncbi:hypothetical protein C8F04DRAFT_1194247 [Mycena alexandri]|uniref:Uncharacterized protein n=1 Tax=Mycena alexandri TaxID=1745969 RepID=A0AAD6SBZ9_9AGAR|nr:hypothetical protein C8F04DRAFT_1194247 [Mycena alexandri]
MYAYATLRPRAVTVVDDVKELSKHSRGAKGREMVTHLRIIVAATRGVSALEDDGDVGELGPEWQLVVVVVKGKNSLPNKEMLSHGSKGEMSKTLKMFMCSPFAPHLGTNYCPKDEEVLKLNAFLVEPSLQLKRLSDEIADLHKTLDKLEEEHQFACPRRCP